MTVAVILGIVILATVIGELLLFFIAILLCKFIHLALLMIPS